MSATAATNGRNPRAPILAAPEPAVTVSESLAAALSAFQGAVPTFPKTKTAIVKTRTGGEYSYKYADLGDILPIVGPLLCEFGLSWTAKPRRAETGEMVLAYRLLHVSGEADAGEIPLGVASDCKPQELGSAITYARRYAMTAQLNLSTEQDDDGQSAQGAASAPTSQSASQPVARPPATSDRPASAAQRGMLQGRAAHLPPADFANIILEGTGEPPRVWQDQDSAVRWTKRALDRLPAKHVDAVLAGIAQADGSQT